MEENFSKVLIQIDSRNVIKAINSSIFITDTKGWIQIDEGVGDKYAHAQNNYFDQTLSDSKGQSNYVYENEKCRLLTEEEKAVLFPLPEQEMTADEIQNDTNIDVDYRLSCLELGI